MLMFPPVGLIDFAYMCMYGIFNRNISDIIDFQWEIYLIGTYSKIGDLYLYSNHFAALV